MTDAELRKEVQDGLGLCLKGLSDLCPYKDSDAPGGCRDELMYDALALLKAQEPVEIKNSAGNGICPGCGRIIPAWSSPNYCGYCGQAVKWK